MDDGRWTAHSSFAHRPSSLVYRPVMTRINSRTSAPWYTRAPLVVGSAVVVGILAFVAWFFLAGPGSPAGDRPTLDFTTEKGEKATEGTVNSPMRANLRIPWSNGSADTALASVSFQLLDRDGKPARFGDVPGEAEAMKPALEIGVWVLDGSLPSEPGQYHARVVLDELKGTTLTFELNDPVLVAQAESGAPPTSGFVFSRDSNLWLLSTDTSKERRLTFYPAFYEYANEPAWSPDGKSVAYTYSPRTAPDEVPHTDIWTVGPDGRGARKAAEHKGDQSLTEPAWSADGKTLYFSVQSSVTETATTAAQGLTVESWRIDSVDVATGQRSQVAANAKMPSVGGPKGTMVYLENLPAKSADGVTPLQRLVRQETGDASTGPSVLVPENTYQLMYAPDMSPDGKWVVFSAINVPPTPPGGFDPFKWLLMEPETASAHGLPWDLFIVPASGGDSARLTTLNEDQPYPAWLDNTTLAFMGTKGLYKMSIDAQGKGVGEPAIIHKGAPHGGLTWHAP